MQQRRKGRQSRKESRGAGTAAAASSRGTSKSSSSSSFWLNTVSEWRRKCTNPFVFKMQLPLHVCGECIQVDRKLQANMHACMHTCIAFICSFAISRVKFLVCHVLCASWKEQMMLACHSEWKKTCWGCRKTKWTVSMPSRRIEKTRNIEGVPSLHTCKNEILLFAAHVFTWWRVVRGTKITSQRTNAAVIIPDKKL